MKAYGSGKLSFDAANRQPWSGSPPAPTPPRFPPDEITREVEELVGDAFAGHPGELDLSRLPACREDAERLWTWARRHCLPAFGPYQDAMSRASGTLFHTLLAPVLNVLRLVPARVVADAVALDVPLQSKEGFVRQVLGWREFVRHVHRETDGFRATPGSYAASVDGAPSFLDAHEPLPPAYWSAESGLACLDTAVRRVWRTGYAHHIDRLMVLANIATLLDVEPRALTDWFWEAFTDAYDWVVEPNVLGMGTFAAGDVMTTKPYVAGSGYIHRMSDYCSACRFDPKTDCPLRALYWAFLDRHRERLEPIQRMRLPLRSLDKRSAERRRADAAVYRSVRTALAAGDVVTPHGGGP